MENTRKMSNKMKNSKTGQSNDITYKHFSTTNNKRRKNRKKYFEHDTRTRNIRTITNANGSAAAIKKIKFNNEINIFETSATTAAEPANGNQVKKSLKPQQSGRNAKMKKKQSRVFRPNRRQNSIGTSNVLIQTTTKKLQKQLIDTHKKLQKQLIALQEQQREQNNSFLALIQSNCLHTNVIKNDDDDDVDNSHPNPIPVISSNSNKKQNKYPNQNQYQYQNSNSHCSDHLYKLFTDQTKCPIDKMANGSKATALRAFICDQNVKSCTASIDSSAKSHTPPKELCNHHHCSNCIERSKTTTCDKFSLTTETISNATLNPNKKPKIQIKKPFLKSIILSAASNQNSTPLLTIKQETDAKDLCTNHTNDSLTRFEDTQIGEYSTSKYQTEMQFSDIKKTKQINSYFKSNNFVQQQNARSYSPPLPVTTQRLASMVTSESHQMANSNNVRQSHTSRERKSSKKRKKRRRSRSRSRSRSYSRSRTRSRSHSRSRSYRRRSTRSKSKSRSHSRSHSRSRSRSTSSEYRARRHSQDGKKKSQSKNRDVSPDVFRRSSKRDERGCACNCNCTNYCKKSSKHSKSKTQSKSPSNDRALSSKRSNNSPTESKINSKKPATTATATAFNTNDANGSSTSKKRSIIMNSGILLKQQPIVKLHSSPASESDTENEIDDKFDRKYEELLTFETNEDERREQRLLKALSDIAAKAKQKIQSITDSNVAKNVHADRNHNDRSTTKTNKIAKQSVKKTTHESRAERRTERQTSEDRNDNGIENSPKDRKSTKRDSSKRSKRDSSYSSTSSKEDKSARSSRSPSIPRRRGSPSFLDRRRITSARKKPIPYQRSSPYDSYDEWESS